VPDVVPAPTFVRPGFVPVELVLELDVVVVVVEDELVEVEVVPLEVGLDGVPGVVVDGAPARWLSGPPVICVEPTCGPVEPLEPELAPELVPDESPPPLLGGVVVTGIRGALVGVVVVWVDVVCDDDWLDEVPPDELPPEEDPPDWLPPLVVVCTGEDTCVIGPDETCPERTGCCCGL